MRVFVRAKAGAKKEFVEKIDTIHYTIAVRAAPQNGKANEAIIRALADYLGIAIARISLVAGATNKNKVFNIT